MGPYTFVIAAILAVIPILVVFKISMERIKEDPQQNTKALTHFFIGVALSEAIPIILIVYGFINITSVANIEELYLPGMILILIAGISAFFIFLQRTFDVDEEIKSLVNSFAMISIVMTNTIPVVSIIALMIMIP